MAKYILEVTLRKESVDNDSEVIQYAAREFELADSVNIREFGGTKPVDNLMLMLDFWCLQLAKAVGYGDSWRKRGEMFSIFPNMTRKWDRVEASINSSIVDPKADPSPRIDGTADLLVYSLLYLGWMREAWPKHYNHWFEGELKSYAQKAINLTRSSKP